MKFKQNQYIIPLKSRFDEPKPVVLDSVMEKVIR